MTTGSILKRVGSLTLKDWGSILAGGVAILAALAKTTAKILAWYRARRPIVVKLMRWQVGLYAAGGWRERVSPAMRISARNRGPHPVRVEAIGLKMRVPGRPDMRIGLPNIGERKLPLEIEPRGVINVDLPISNNPAYESPHLRAYVVLVTGEEYQSRSARPPDRNATTPTVVTTRARGDDR